MSESDHNATNQDHTEHGSAEAGTSTNPINVQTTYDGVDAPYRKSLYYTMNGLVMADTGIQEEQPVGTYSVLWKTQEAAYRGTYDKYIGIRGNENGIKVIYHNEEDDYYYEHELDKVDGHDAYLASHPITVGDVQNSEMLSREELANYEQIDAYDYNNDGSIGSVDNNHHSGGSGEGSHHGSATDSDHGTDGDHPHTGSDGEDSSVTIHTVLYDGTDVPYKQSIYYLTDHKIVISDENGMQSGADKPSQYKEMHNADSKTYPLYDDVVGIFKKGKRGVSVITRNTEGEYNNQSFNWNKKGHAKLKGKVKTVKHSLLKKWEVKKGIDFSSDGNLGTIGTPINESDANSDTATVSAVLYDNSSIQGGASNAIYYLSDHSIVHSDNAGLTSGESPDQMKPLLNKDGDTYGLRDHVVGLFNTKKGFTIVSCDAEGAYKSHSFTWNGDEAAQIKGQAKGLGKGKLKRWEKKMDMDLSGDGKVGKVKKVKDYGHDEGSDHSDHEGTETGHDYGNGHGEGSDHSGHDGGGSDSEAGSTSLINYQVKWDGSDAPINSRIYYSNEGLVISEQIVDPRGTIDTYTKFVTQEGSDKDLITNNYHGSLEDTIIGVIYTDSGQGGSSYSLISQNNTDPDNYTDYDFRIDPSVEGNGIAIGHPDGPAAYDISKLYQQEMTDSYDYNNDGKTGDI